MTWILSISTRSDGDCDDCFIGHVETDDIDLELKLDDLWAEWHEENEHPDCDSEFIGWLIEKGHARSPSVALSHYTIQV